MYLGLEPKLTFRRMLLPSASLAANFLHTNVIGKPFWFGVMALLKWKIKKMSWLAKIPHMKCMKNPKGLNASVSHPMSMGFQSRPIYGVS